MTLKLISSMATRELLAELLDDWHRQGGFAVQAEAAGGVEVEQRLQAGEVADVIVLARPAIERLGNGGWVRPDSCVDLAHSGIAVAIRAGTPLPAIHDEAALRKAVLAARTLGYSTGPSGQYLEQQFERWGALPQLRARIVVPPPGVPVGRLVADGTVELGFQQLSELLGLSGVQVVGPLPAGIQHTTIFSGAIGSASSQLPEAAQLLAFLASPATEAAKRRLGMDPPDG